ncbi:bicaudal-D-related protein 2-like [Anoplopoma fimbria]|uniref:bicaudal-D-related protein 2-like n=1 Tax=Anoplopoma fimbria TaxID=229290 RepID=UPI0023EDCAE6|nr:bicaudal-D-related protein 2-like [Anoplopoma fimbria]
MDRAQPFSDLNDRLRPQGTSSEQVFSSLNRMEHRRLASIGKNTSSIRNTVLPTEPEPKVSKSERDNDSEQEDLVSDEDNCADLLNSPILITKLNLNDFGEKELADDNRSISSSEEKDQPGELGSEGSGHNSGSVALDGEDGSPFQGNCMNGTLPDLLNGGKPLSRRRTLGHVSETLKEVRREVELSRKRSIRLKAQVDKLQEGRVGPRWSQHRERVTEEVLSILQLLGPLTESGSSLDAKPSPGENHLDTSLAQLRNVAHELAFSHTSQLKSGKGAEENAILQQALRDRDEAIEKKKAMEAELLRSKTEMMLLNNQLLEAVQKRLELSLELETWKEDVQRIIHQQLQSQQAAEQAQKKTSRLGLLRRTNKAPIQRPTNFLSSLSASPITNTNQIFIPRASAATPSTPPSTPRTWRDRLRIAKNGPEEAQNAAGQESVGKGEGDFQVVSLD